MSWLSDLQDPAAMRERAVKSIAVPLGMANPFWFAFGAAASAGAAWWLMTRLARPVNLEAGLALATAEAGPAIAMPVEPVRLTFAPPEAEAEVARVEVDPIEAAPQAKGPIEAASVAEAVAEAAPEAAVVTAPEAAMADPEDDLTQLVGVGPRTALALKARGVTRFAHLAAWSPEQLAAFDAELNLKGRGVRDAWIAQARRLSGAA